MTTATAQASHAEAAPLAALPRPGFGLRRALRVASATLLATCCLVAAIVLVPSLLGYQRYVITGGSMTGTYDRGSLVFDKTVATSDLRVGDVITYTPPPNAGPRGRITHRIVGIGRTPQGERAFRTKGDANRTADPWKFELRHPTQARVAFHVPYVGFALAALSDRWVRMLVIGLPALLIGIGSLARLWRDAGVESRKRREAAEAPRS